MNNPKESYKTRNADIFKIFDDITINEKKVFYEFYVINIISLSKSKVVNLDIIGEVFPLKVEISELIIRVKTFL